MKYCKTRASALKKGRPKYKTGVPCSRGHNAPRYTLTRRCVECDRLNKKSRHEAIKLRTPSWADMDKISEIYNKSRSLGCDYNVDHDIPLQGKFVSGLHVPENLVIVESTENFSKQNKFEVK